MTPDQPREEYGEWMLVPWEDERGDYLTKVAGDPIDRPVPVIESAYADELEAQIKRLKAKVIDAREERDAARAYAIVESKK